MGFLNTLKSIGSKVLRVGGNVAKTIGNIGGKVADFASKNANWMGNIAGGALTALGMPYLGAGAVALGNTIQKVANAKPTQNVLRGISDVGQVAQDASQMLRR